MKTSVAFRFLFSALALVVALYATAAKASRSQPCTGQLSGVILDGATHEPIPLTNVVLLRASDQAYVATVATRADGSFQFKGLPHGQYQVRPIILGYEPFRSVVQLDTQHPQQSLGHVSLVPFGKPVAGVAMRTQLSTRAWLNTRS
jgi:hypothetical protein